MAEKTSGYDGEIDWEAEIIAADLAALQKADRAKADGDNQKPNFGKRKLSFFQKLKRKMREAGGVCFVPDPDDLPIGVKGPQPHAVTREQKRKLEQLAADSAVASGRRNANGIVRGVMALLAIVLSMTADAALRPAELVDVGYGYMQPETVNVVNGAQVFYKDIYQYFSEKYQTTDWMELEGLIPYGMWEGYVVTEVNSVLEDGDIANFKVPSRYYYQRGYAVDDAPNWWEPVVGIDSDVMRGRAIRGLLLPDNLVFVGDRAFESCHELRYVGFGDTVSNLGERVFADCTSLDHVHLPTNAWLGVAAFSNCVSLTDVVLPRYPTAIHDRCFMDCAALTRVALPNAVERIGAGAFARTGLEKLTMPTNLVEIQDGAFSGCTNLSAALFFENLTSIASNAFAGCSRLTKLVFLGKAPTVEGGALDGVPSNAIVYVTDRWDGPRDRWCGLEVRMYEGHPLLMQFIWNDTVATICCYPDFHCGELPTIPLRYVKTGYYGYYGYWIDESYYELSFETWRYLDGGLPTPFDIIVSDTNAVSSMFAEGERKTVMFDLPDSTGDYMDWGFSLYDTIENLCYKYGEYGGVSSSIELWCDRLAALPDVWACEPAPSIFVGWDMDFADIAQSPTNLSVHAVYRWKTAGESFNESGLSRYVLDAEALAVDGIVQFSGVIELDESAAKLYDVGVARSFQMFERQFENLNLQLVGVSGDGRERKVLKTMPLEMVVYQMFHDYYYLYETGPIVDRWVMQIPLSDIEGCEYFELQLVSGAMSYYWPYDEVVTGDVHMPEWSNPHLWASLVDCRNQPVEEIGGRYWDSDAYCYVTATATNFPHVQCGDVLKFVGGDDLELSIDRYYYYSNPLFQYGRLQGRLGQWLQLDYEYGSDPQPVYYIQIPEVDSWKWDYDYSDYGSTYYDQAAFHNDWFDFYWDRGIWYDIRWDYDAARFQSRQIKIQTSADYWPMYEDGRAPIQFKILLPGTDIIYYDLGRYGRLTNSTPEYVVDCDGQKCWCAEGERPILGDENLSQVVYWRVTAPEGINLQYWWLDPIPVPDVSTNDDFLVATGWSFVGWSKDPSKAVNKDVLVAQYEMTEYCLVYENTKGAQNSNPTNFTMVDAIEFAVLPDIPGWMFRGWSPKSIKVGTIGDVTVTAEWEQISNAVVFAEGAHGRRCGGGELRQMVAWGACAQVPQIVADDGWRFVGWDGDVTLPITNAVTFAAQYEPIVYGITFEDTKGCVNSNTNAYTVKDAIVFSPLSDLPEWHFDGWSPASIPLDSTGDITVTALWRPIVDAHIVGTWSEPQTFEYDGFAQGVGYSARLDVMDWPLNVTTQGTVRAVNVGEYAATAMAEAIGVPETDEVYYRCAAVTNECRWSIVPKPVTKLLITYVSTAMIANGRPQTPQIVVRDVERGVLLTESDYTLAYENNVEPGMGIARIAGKGNYGGETAIGFPIVAGVNAVEGLNMDDRTFEIADGSDWIADNAETHDGYASMRSGAIGDNGMSALTAVVHGAGTVSFWWKVSSQHFDSVLELDRLEFYVDGVRQRWINGERDWAKLSFKINGAGPHEIRWVYVKDGSVSEGRDCGWVDEVAWNKEWLIGDWLNDVDRTFATSSVNWQPDASVCTDGVGSMRSGACRQGQRSVLSTAVENAGTLTFKWKSSCAAYGEYITDKLSLLVDGEPVKDADGKDIFIRGQTDWRDVSYRITGAGRHEVQWIFEKVSDASVGENCGWVDVVNWDTEPGTLTDDDLVVVAFDGVYDGRGHGASVSVKGAKVATVKYGTSRESMDAADSPTFEECGEHEVWFSVNVPDFHEFVGKTVVRISPRSIAGGKVTLGAALAYTGAVQTQEVSSVVADGLAATFAVLDNGVRDAGTYRLKVVGTGNFCGELSVPYVVAKARAPADNVTVAGYSQAADAVVFAYDGKPHQPTVVAGYDGEAAIRFSLTEEGPYSEELDVSNAVERLEVWYEIVSANYEGMIGNTRMTIRPLSIANAEVVLGEQVSDAEGRVVQLVDHVIADGLPATFEVADNVADEEGDFMLTVRGVGNFTGETKCPYSVGGIVLPPLMTPGDGTVFTNSQVVYFSAQTPGSKWYYTLDGTMPTTNSASASRANLHGKTTIRAIAILEGKLRSAVVEAHYALGTCGNPTIRLDGLSGQVFHFPGQMVVIEKREDEGVVRYTLDGSEPTAESRAYERPFAISETTTVKAKVFSESWFDSETVTAEMRFEVLSVPAPVIRVAGEYRGTRTTVSMSCALDGAVIRYTLDGSEPTAESAVYEAPMEIGGEVGSVILVKARAFRELYADSPVAEASATRLWGVGDALGVPDMDFADTDWTVDGQTAFNGRASMRSGTIGDGGTSALETVVRGGGAVAFSWRTSCEDSDGDFIWDRAEFWVDGDCVARLEGESGWCTVTHELPGGNSEHRLRWLYVKDPEPGTTDGEDCAWLAELTWEPKEVTAGAIVVDDPNGKIVLPAGKDISEVEVRVMNRGHDIFPYLDLPAARDGVIDLSQATVKAEIVKEALDPEQGAEIKLDPANPTLTTANTRKGLTYTLYEGEALEGMKAGDSTLGDGQPWTPRIEVRGGASAFYTIGVGK